MEKINVKKEIVFWILLIIPFVYLASVWNELPERVPIHFGIDGQPNRWGGRAAEIIIPSLNIAVYLLLLFIPNIDPKKMNYEFFKNIYFKIRLVINFFLFVFSILIIHTVFTGNHAEIRWIYAADFLLFALLGNFIVHIKSNWFIGVRTPWTLSSDAVWKRTHLVFGRIWFYGGLLCFVLALFIRRKEWLVALVLIFILGSAISAVVYSYWLYRKEEKAKIQSH